MESGGRKPRATVELLAIGRYFPPSKPSAILASHADPDIIASLDRWMTSTQATLYISRLWERFAPHFMHSEGNLQFWDPVSRILFSGDLGVSMASSADAACTVTSLAGHIPRMESFHRRYMVSGKVLRLWAHMARTLAIRMIVPQHGALLAGAAVGEFIDWVSDFSCDVDHLTQANYTVPA
ncbi:hypothetical protein [Hydrogenophaga sp.]|uniref:hypothetical protein n=1 Tax=Hydrogenophaga sp. TaxID=1904254 RepID=UPI003524CCF8